MADDALIQPTPDALRNPFAVKSPEELTREQIVRLFVPQYTKLEQIKERKHTFIWGSRGSGKSMMLRYLEPQCKAIVHGSLDNFLANPNSFIGVYCPCKEGQLNKTELDLLPPYPQLVVTEHLLNLSIAELVLRCLNEQFPSEYFSVDDSKRFTKDVLALFDRASVAASAAQADEGADRQARPLLWLDGLFRAELARVSRYLRELALSPVPAQYDAATTGYHDFLLPFVRATRALLQHRSVPIFILLDDADHLRPLQQRIVNTWMANRDQRDMCLKVSARRDGYAAFTTRDGVDIEEPHDYSTVDVDELYTVSKSDYARKVHLVADRRLELSGVPTRDIEAFLPSDPVQDALLAEVKQSTAAEWETAGRPGRQADFVARYAVARLFQRLRQTKQRRNYAGFENIVHLSAGVIRDFLEPCYLMFARLLDEGKEPKDIAQIPPSVQDDVLFRYSEDFLIHRFVAIRQGSSPDQWERLGRLETLIASLGKLFYERLHDEDAREARLFSFTVRGQVPPALEEVLQLGVQHRYFQMRSYSRKEGGGREKWYILNRRLCPALKLDPTGFEGRISVTPEHLQLACENPDKFVRLRLKQGSNDEAPLFSLEEEE